MKVHSASALPSLTDILQANPGWLEEAVLTAEASQITGEPIPTLETKRVRGGGPVFLKLGKSVRYTRRACFEYLAERQRTSTSDSGQAAA